MEPMPPDTVLIDRLWSILLVTRQEYPYPRDGRVDARASELLQTLGHIGSLAHEAITRYERSRPPPAPSVQPRRRSETKAEAPSAEASTGDSSDVSPADDTQI